MNLFLPLLIILISDSASLCGKNYCGHHNLESEDFTSPSTFPWHVRIEGDQTCGGVLISPIHVLTAAHCVTQWLRNTVTKVDLHSLSLTFGLHNRTDIEDKGIQIGLVRHIEYHEEYSEDTNHADIAILTLAESVRVNERVNLICLTVKEVPDDTVCYVTGFGLHDSSGKESEKLRIIRTPYMERQKCGRLLKKILPDKNFTSTMCCAGGANGSLDVCKGDSGGPLVCLIDNKWQLQGLVSWGSIENCGKITNVPGIYTNVPKLYKWIRLATGIDTDESHYWQDPLCPLPINPNTFGSKLRATEPPIQKENFTDPKYKRYCSPKYDGYQEVLLLNGSLLLVDCNSNRYGSGWLVIERRMSGQLDFHQRQGADFIFGFGNISDDFWIGLDAMWQLTSAKPIEISMDVVWCDWQNATYVYKNFEVGPANYGYKLSIQQGPNDDPNEGLGIFNNQSFYYGDPISGRHEFTGWWWSDKPTVSLHQQLGCDISQPANNFWYTRSRQRRRIVKSFELKIRPMEETTEKTQYFAAPRPKSFQKRPVPKRNATELQSSPLRHCQEIFEFGLVQTSGPQEIKLDNGQLREVQCEMTIDGGGWTVIQQRSDGNEHFERNWTEYANGFGNVSADHWAGNILISQLTTTEEQMELRLEYQECGNSSSNTTTHVYKYINFVVGDESTNFTLLVLTEPNYTTTTFSRNKWEVDGFAYNRGWEFSAPNITASKRFCVRHMVGGWWYNACGTLLNFNGKFGCNETFPNANFELLNAMPNIRMIKSTSMMIRPYKPSANLQSAPWPRPAYSKHLLPRDCQEYFEKNPDTKDKRIAVAVDVLHDLEPGHLIWCEADSDSGDIWTFIMSRHEGNENFERSWIDYKFGFGNPKEGNDHWIGNQYLWAITSWKIWELKIVVTFCDGKKFSETYDFFKVAGETKRFRISFDGKNDEFSKLSGNEFSTIPFGYGEPNCASMNGGGGWWLSSDTSNCGYVSFNGKLDCFESYPSCTYWRSSKNSTIHIIKTVEMKMRRV